jgi:hypothetical protein
MSPDSACGEVQLPQSDSFVESKRHLNVEFGSFDVKPKLAEVAFVVDAGLVAWVIVVSGGVPSTVHVWL